MCGYVERQAVTLSTGYLTPSGVVTLKLVQRVVDPPSVIMRVVTVHRSQCVTLNKSHDEQPCVLRQISVAWYSRYLLTSRRLIEI